MKIIITETQYQKISQIYFTKNEISESVSQKMKLQKLVKEFGLKKALISVGSENLMKIGFDDDPLMLLDFIFDDLDRVSAENLDSTYFIVNGVNEVLMQWQYRLGDLYVSNIFYDTLNSFGLDPYDIEELISEWVGKKFNIKHPAIEFTDYFSEDIDY